MLLLLLGFFCFFLGGGGCGNRCVGCVGMLLGVKWVGVDRWVGMLIGVG